MRSTDFDYPLPAERIAQEPLGERDASRLLHLLPDGSLGAWAALAALGIIAGQLLRPIAQLCRDLAGDDAPEDILRSVKRGLYAVNFGGGQVDITNGKFVFSASEAYLIEDGKITAPVRDATLIGNGPEALKYVSMVGNDLKLDEGIGTCGKDGQSVPVGVGMPTIKLDKMTVGGTGR